MAIHHPPNSYLSVAFVTVAVVCLFRVNECAGQHPPPTKIDLLCNYNNTIINHYHPHAIYVCNLYDLNITTKVEIGKFKGTHLPGKSDKDVQMLRFLNGTMFYIPNGIGQFFTNLTRLLVGDFHTLSSISTKAVERKNFEDLENLQEISFVSNDIKKWDKDALWDLPNLQMFVLAAMRIKFLNIRTFERNQKLRAVAMCSTELRHLTEHLFRYNLLLEAVFFDNNVIETISERSFQTNTKLRTVSLRLNKLVSLPADLFKNNPLLSGLHFGDNILANIKIDFTKFQNIKFIGLEHNECIDAIYNRSSVHRHVHIYNNLTKFQRLIKANCGSHSSSSF